MVENRNINYLLPTKIKERLFCDNDISLLSENEPVITLYENDCLTIKKGGYIVLDFGQELAGGIRILVSRIVDEKESYNLRLRFGESLSECNSNIGEKNSTNNHSLRDFEITIPSLSDQCFGDTGFRFLRIDLLSNEPIKIKKIYAKSFSHNYKSKFEFNFSDKKINQILNTAKHTLDLCIQNYIFDGIKRDRLVWIGDMGPEVKAILYLYGNIPQIEDSLFIAEKTNPQPCYMYNIPSYSIWYLLIVNDVFEQTKDNLFISRHLNYINQILFLFDSCITKEGILDYNTSSILKSDCYFIDWPNSQANKEEMKDANKNFLIYVLNELQNGFAKNNGDLMEKTKKMLEKLMKAQTKTSTIKTFAAFHYLVNKDDYSYNVLTENGGHGFSTFMSYFILTAIADRDLKKAVEVMKEYYGGMLKINATTFFENFDLEWIKNSNKLDELPKKGQKDIHGDFGNFCYEGFRHSLCHGWSVGPISFIFENKRKLLGN